MTQTKQPKTGSKFTAGPWQLKGREVWGSDKHISQVTRAPFRPYPDSDEAEANARLIAAAPEMYELLKVIEQTDDKAMDSIPTMPSLHEWVAIARTARRIKAAVDGEG